jgi:molybdopterin synthase catalytic subunit
MASWSDRARRCGCFCSPRPAKPSVAPRSTGRCPVRGYRPRNSYARSRRSTRDSVRRSGRAASYATAATSTNWASGSVRATSSRSTRPTEGADVSVQLTSHPLSVAAAMAALEGPGAGGVVIFAGRVRPDRTRSGPVVALEYEAHGPPALARLRTLERSARRRFATRRVVLWHRVGRLRVGEVSVIVGAACAHRAEAFAAARYLIEELKAVVPIWKTERARPARRPRPRPSPRGARSAD